MNAVSVIVPNYNYGRYLDERLQSLLNQTFTDLEVIVVDDASTDDSREVVSRYTGDARVKTAWFDQQSGSAYRRWNDGARQASGRYLHFAGADDACEPALIERLVEALERHPQAGLAYSRCQVIDSDGRPQSIIPSHPRWESDFVSSPEEELPFLLDQRTIPTASAVLVRRDLFERCGGFDTSFELAADHMLWAQVLRQSGFAYVADALSRFRTHDRTVRAQAKSTTRVMERYRVYGFILRAFEVDDNARERTLERLARHWIECWRGDRQSDRWRRHRAIYRAATLADPRLRARLARLAIEASTDVRVRSPRAVARYAYRRYRDEQYLLGGRRISWRYTAHYRSAKRAFQRERPQVAPVHGPYAVGVTVIGSNDAATALSLPSSHAASVRRVAAAANGALADVRQCRFVPALSTPSATVDTAALDDVVQRRIIAIQVCDPLQLDGLHELGEPLLQQLEDRVFGCHLIADKVYVYRSPISRQQPRASWLWHFDNHPREVLKVMVYLSDVDDEGAAPFEYLRGCDGRPLYGSPLAPMHHHSRITPEFVEQSLAAGATRQAVIGASGTTIVFDDNVIHRGTIARTRARDVVVFQVRPVAFRAWPRIDRRWTGSFLHHNINRDPADVRPHLRAASETQ